MRIARLPIVILLAAGCVNAPQETSTGGAAKAPHSGPVRIGFSMDTLKEERWQRDKRLVEQRAKDVEAAHRKGVPVISYDRLIRDADVDLYLSHQVEKIGEMQADYAIKHVPKGNYVLIGGSPTDYNALLLRKGQMNVLKPAIERKDIKVISEQFAREWKAEEALRITEDALTRTGNKIQAIVASNDGTAGGAISALEAAGLAGKVLVTGQDAQRDAVQRIVKGTQTMTVYKPIQPLAFGAVDAAIKLAKKQPVDAPDKINNGKKDVPAILIQAIVVDKSNVDSTVIKDGYFTHTEIYGH
jgi:D-xylose transport system substrate-binding protein